MYKCILNVYFETLINYMYMYIALYMKLKNV